MRILRKNMIYKFYKVILQDRHHKFVHLENDDRIFNMWMIG